MFNINDIPVKDLMRLSELLDAADELKHQLGREKVEQFANISTPFQNPAPGPIHTPEQLNQRAWEDALIGEFVLVRSYNEGVNSGTVVHVDASGIILENSRRLWKHAPKDPHMAWYEGVAMSGLDPESMLSPSVPVKAIREDYTAVVCTNIAMDSINEYPNYEHA